MMFPIPAEAWFVVARYVVSWAFTALATHGYIRGDVPDEVIRGTTQIALGIGGAVAMLAWGLWRDHEKLIAAIRTVAHLPGVKTLHVDPQLAATLQAQGVPNVVPTPPAQP